jgi:glycyl-radical enzyme activating protein
MTGTVFDIQRFSIHDGPGIRTTVFLKGCPLSCPWCHNPEGQKTAREMSFSDDKCAKCGACVNACRAGSHRIEEGIHEIDPAVCKLCGMCVDACLAGALEIIGGEKSVDDVIGVVERDAPFYKRSGGGMTLSGGEPLAQPRFSLALLEAAKNLGFHTCMETSGYGNAGSFEKIVEKLDLIYFDVKETNSDRHREVCGVDREQLLVNLAVADRAGIEIVLRCPIVPGINDRPDHFAGIAELAEQYAGVTAVHVLPYHRLGSDKQKRLADVEQQVFDPPEDEVVEAWINAIATGTAKPVERG